jgi:lipoprotein NlpI
MAKWPAPIVKFYLGKMTFEELRGAADDPNVVKRQGQLCEANFYAGELALANHKRTEAVELLRFAAENCPKNFLEWPAAVTELRAAEAKR